MGVLSLAAAAAVFVVFALKQDFLRLNKKRLFGNWLSVMPQKKAFRKFG
jgi:hypothetical protein